MASFVTRVELHGASAADYERLHVAMERSGFSRQIQADNGNCFQLPTAEYCHQGNYDAASVNDAAEKAAATTGRRCWTFTAEYKAASFRLPLANRARSLI